MKGKFLYSILSSLTVATVLATATTGCDHDPWHDDEEDRPNDVVIIQPSDDYPSSSQNAQSMECSAVSSTTYYFNDYQDQYSQKNYRCYEKAPYRYMTSCEQGDCSQVPVYVHYGLKDTLQGDNYIVHVEAFDNPSFNGYPIGSVEISHYKAEPGYWKDTELWLPEGDFYLRAFLSNEESPNRPYQFGDMVLIQDQPVGVLGVLSGPEQVHVDYRRAYTEPVSIHLDQLFKKPGTEPETNARVRTVVKLPEGFTADTGKEVRIELHSTLDFEASPVASMKIKSDFFMIQGQLGKAEVVSESLEPGNYFVRAYYDTNMNGFFDEDELVAVFGGAETPERVAVQKDHTRSLTLTLAP